MNAIFQKILQVIIPFPFKLLSKPIKYYLKYQNNRSRETKYHPVFIIGAPRTGSTIIYQAITNQFDVLYIDNITCLFHQFLPWGMKISKIIYSNKPHNTYKSKFGNTNNYGYHAPSECGNFWYRWLPKDRHFIDYCDFNEHVVHDIHTEIYSTIKSEGKPIVFKNLTMGQRLRLIHSIAPSAKIIIIVRDTLETSLSIYNGRMNNNIKDDEWWGIMPPNKESLNCLPVYEKIVNQIFYIEKQIMIDKKLFPKKNIITISYEDFIANPGFTLNKIRVFISEDLKERDKVKKLNIEKKQHKYDTVVRNRLKREIEKFNWDFL